MARPVRHKRPGSGKTVRVEGLAELRRACQLAGDKMTTDMNTAMKSAGEVVRRDAEIITRSIIKPGQVDWSAMRLGIAKNTVYVAPVERGVKSRTRRGKRREKFKVKLLDEAMFPALERNHEKVAQEFEDAVKDMGKAWARV